MEDRLAQGAPGTLPPTSNLTGPQCYADLLRAAGQLFDEHRARAVEIHAHDDFWLVSFTGLSSDPPEPPRSRLFHALDLQQLATEAQLLREGPVPAALASGIHAELLRTLGQELDAARIRLHELQELHAAYRVHGTAPHGPVTQLVPLADLAVLSQQRQAHRQSAATEAGSPGGRCESTGWGGIFGSAESGRRS
jgi:hypothetical protein